MGPPMIDVPQMKKKIFDVVSALISPPAYTKGDVDLKDYNECVCGRKRKESETFDRMQKGSFDR